MPCSKKEIGDRIIALRTARGLSQLELAKGLHVSREVVAKWETGTRDLKTEHTIALADYFDVSCDEILRGIKSENVAIAEKIGLNDLAINNLEQLKDVACVNDLICSEFFGNEYADFNFNYFMRLVSELSNYAKEFASLTKRGHEGNDEIIDELTNRLERDLPTNADWSLKFVVRPGLIVGEGEPFLIRRYKIHKYAEGLIDELIYAGTLKLLQKEASQNGKRSKN